LPRVFRFLFVIIINRNNCVLVLTTATAENLLTCFKECVLKENRQNKEHQQEVERQNAERLSSHEIELVPVRIGRGLVEVGDVDETVHADQPIDQP